MTSPPAAQDHFWSLAEPLLERPGVERSTMMGFPCLRLDGQFFASYDPSRGALVVKLDRDAVTHLLADGGGQAFAPNGRRFREWISIPAEQSSAWPDHLETALRFAAARAARSPADR